MDETKAYIEVKAVIKGDSKSINTEFIIPVRSQKDIDDLFRYISYAIKDYLNDF